MSEVRKNTHQAAEKVSKAYDETTDKLPESSEVRSKSHNAASKAADTWENLSSEAQDAKKKAAEEWEHVKDQLPSQEEIQRKAQYAAGKLQEGWEAFEDEAAFIGKKAGGAVERVGSPIAAYFSNTDPLRQWLMSGLCLGASGYAFSYLRNTNAGWLAAGIGALYAYGANLIGLADYQLGYDLTSAASIGVIAMSGRKAFNTNEGFSVILAILGGITGLTNITKAYQIRYGKYQRRTVKRY